MILLRIIILIYLYKQGLVSGFKVSFDMKIGKPEGKSAFQCEGRQQFIRIVNATTDLTRRKKLTQNIITSLQSGCNCRTICCIPELRPKKKSWHLFIFYHCTIEGCEDEGSSVSRFTCNDTTSVTGPTTVSETITTEIRALTDTNDKTVASAVSVSVAVLVIGGVVIGVLLFRRWQLSKREGGIYCSHTGDNVKDSADGFANPAYSNSEDATSDKASILNSDDTCCRSDDSGYNGLHTKANHNDTNTEYCHINEEYESETLKPDDDYYAIKENVDSEYNKIAFRPKSIPEDPSYGHTHFVRNNKDKTYDHLDENGLQLQDVDLVNDSYSHLNENKTNMRPVLLNTSHESETIESNIDTEGSGRKYFILEQHDSSILAEYENENDDSHKYFVLDKENIEKKTSKDQNNTAASAVERKDISNNFTDHTYFQNYKREEIDLDIHEYKRIELDFVSGLKTDGLDVENHDYFILEKEDNV